MEDSNKQPPSFSNGQQRNPHPRPFFYVQPPSQPYYFYQPWQLNNPYSHYGLSAGFNFARPCMHPIQYMPYPGVVFPHTSIYPMDYRRMFEPRFQAPTWGEMPRQQYNPQPQGHREMACSEAQTDPSDAITKLIECLDKIRASEMQGASRELDSGIASQSSGMLSPGGKKKSQEQGNALPSVPQNSHTEGLVESPAAAVESSRTIVDSLSPQVSWSGDLEEELPIDSSSLQEDCPELEHSETDDHLLSAEEEEVQSDTSSVSKCDLLKSPMPLKIAESSDKVSNAEHPEESANEAKPDRSYQILKLPFDCILTPGSACLASPSAPYYYNYISMQATNERMSVLSPSLDELSSRDEMFSTDLDDVDLFPKHVYAPRRLSEVIDGSLQSAKDVEEAWMSGSCACCGKSLVKGKNRSKIQNSKMYLDERGDSDEEGGYGRGRKQPVRVVVRKSCSPRRSHPVLPRHASKPWNKRGLCKEMSDQVEDEDGYQQEAAQGETGESELQCRTYEDRLCREDPTTSDQGRWADDDVIPRRRPAASVQRQAATEEEAQVKVNEDAEKDKRRHFELQMRVFPKEPMSRR
ncbi:bucky ball isoform X1 [Acanthochromis polyacanthus]|uniref:bucky ball isoform X1 n=1 Tax=Acanthochromis polyacanthus TaxID=80966 RepID=UPI002234869F|nr:bucky ball isoform X1 [Acanthochromis polyacanthus]